MFVISFSTWWRSNGWWVLVGDWTGSGLINSLISFWCVCFSHCCLVFNQNSSCSWYYLRDLAAKQEAIFSSSLVGELCSKVILQWQQDTQTDHLTDQRHLYRENIDFTNAEVPEPAPLYTINDASIFYIVFVCGDCTIVFLLVKITYVLYSTFKTYTPRQLFLCHSICCFICAYQSTTSQQRRGQSIVYHNKDCVKYVCKVFKLQYNCNYFFGIS